jgi:rare lipoprotein A
VNSDSQAPQSPVPHVRTQTVPHVPAGFIGGNVGKLRLPIAALFLITVTLLTGCGGGHKKTQARIPTPPPTISRAPDRNTQARTRKPSDPEPDEEISADSRRSSRGIPDTGAPALYTETGLASWYGPPYHNRRAANGEIFNMNEPTAAHRTLPLNSLVRVTNLASGRSIVVRITDRGPFIEGRILDLSLAAAREIDLYRAGVARVRMDVLETPAPLDTGGRWCVQIGAFDDPGRAEDLKDKLARRYRTARVLQFAGPTGEWLRVRVLDDDRRRAEQLAAETHSDQGAVFLVRLD